MLTSLGAYIRDRRRALGLTQEQLAERIGGPVTQADISRLETDRVVLPRRDRLAALAHSLEVSLGDLLLNSGWMTDGDGLAHALAVTVRTADALPHNGPASLKTTEELAATIRAVQAMVGDMALALERAQRTLDAVQRQLDMPPNPRGLGGTSVGIVDRWETTAIFFG